jgi:hypothetical protein
MEYTVCPDYIASPDKKAQVLGLIGLVLIYHSMARERAYFCSEVSPGIEKKIAPELFALTLTHNSPLVDSQPCFEQIAFNWSSLHLKSPNKGQFDGFST